MKTLVIGLLLLSAVAHGRAQTRTGTTVVSSAILNSAGFELCFASQGGRCFQTFKTEDGKLLLRQFGGLSDSEASITPPQIGTLKKDIASLYASSAYAKPLKTRPCKRPLVFKTQREKVGTDLLSQTRCLERLKPVDSEKLLSLVSKISLASKP